MTVGRTTPGRPTPAERLAALEAELAIPELAARYAAAVDGRDLNALVQLFAEDVDCGTWGVGRAALHAFYAEVLQGFYRSIHHLGGQTIEIVDAEHARGEVYCRAEHEVAGRWIVALMCYHDDYERRDGDWFFRKRRPFAWSAADWLERPSGPEFFKWENHRPAALPGRFASWRTFWDAAGSDAERAVTTAPR